MEPSFFILNAANFTVYSLLLDAHHLRFTLIR